MHFSPTATILDGYSMVNSVNSNPFRMESYNFLAIQAVFTGSPTGTFKLQCSVDQGSDNIGTNVTNWSDIDGSSQAVSAAGDIFWELVTAAKWVRVVYTFSSGSGSLTIKAFAKGAR